MAGDDVWKQLGKLTDAQKGLIEDKFKWKVSRPVNVDSDYFVCFLLMAPIWRTSLFAAFFASSFPAMMKFRGQFS
jgi:hypothetical protein